MKITCALSDFDFTNLASDLDVVLYGRPNKFGQGSVAATLKHDILRKKLVPASRAWDLLSISLSVICADLAGHRKFSPDGWTREFELTISVVDEPFWNANAAIFQQLLSFLTTDRWQLNFVENGILPKPDKSAVYPQEDCVVLLSGGLDSLIGTIDLVANGKRPLAVSQKVRGDVDKQRLFAKKIGGSLELFQVNHNAKLPNPEHSPSQRARSIIFLAYGVLVATTLARYHQGERVTLYFCENGFISINPPLTAGRIGSLSTRTTHPVVFSLLQQILDRARINVEIINPYRFKTKGEMLKECQNQVLLKSLAFETTSCGRFGTYNYKHCGRCVPCLVRRSAFQAWMGNDKTNYFYDNLSLKDEKHAGFDDVRSMLIAISEWKEQGTQRWLGASLSSSLIQDKREISNMIEHGLVEIESYLNFLDVQ